MPGYLFNYKHFKESIESPAILDGDEDAMQRLKRMISPFILRRLKKDVLKDLPDKKKDERDGYDIAHYTDRDSRCKRDLKKAGCKQNIIPVLIFCKKVQNNNNRQKNKSKDKARKNQEKSSR